MLETLRKMPPQAKKKVVASCAGLLTLMIFGVWLLHVLGVFSSAYDSAHSQGVALFSFVEQNVDQAYNAFEKNAPNITGSSTVAAYDTNASSTDIGSLATTTNN